MARLTTTRLRWQALAAGAGIVIVLAAALFTEFPGRLSRFVEDRLLRLTTSQLLPKDFVLLAIDETTLGLHTVEPHEIAQSRALQLMLEGYPWSREVYGLLVDRLVNAGARLVIFDLLFANPRAGDEAFAAAIRRHPGRVALAWHFENTKSGGQGDELTLLRPTPLLAEAAGTSMGFATLPAQNIVRWVLAEATTSTMTGGAPLPEETIEPFLQTTAARALGAKAPDSLSPLRFRYSVPHSADTRSFYEVFAQGTWEANYAGRGYFKDRVVLVGHTSEGMKDFFTTPFERLSGPEIHLHILAAILRGDWLESAGPAAILASIPLAGLASFLMVMFRRNTAVTVAGLIGGLVLWLAVCAGALAWTNSFLPTAPPLLAWLVCGVAGLACDVSLERRERSRMRRTLERYVSRDVVKEIVDNPDSYLHSLGGQRKEIVALFSDLQGFTAESERLDAAELVALLNEYFADMVDVVFERRGTLDKFIGDALMATWGCMQAPGLAENARDAVAAALEMKRRLQAINERRRQLGRPPWDSGIGISQGAAIFGNIGSQQKMEPTVIGDTVNLASRIEALTRVYGCGILVDERIAENARSEFSFLRVDTVRVKGRRKPETLYFPHREPAADWTAQFSAAREKYAAGDFSAALAQFTALGDGGLAPGIAARFKARCEGFLRMPPAAQWTGIWDFLEK